MRRVATVKAATNLVVLSLDRYTFVNVLGPLQDIMNKEKSAEVRYLGTAACCASCSPQGTRGAKHSLLFVATSPCALQNVNQRMAKLKPSGSAAMRRPTADVIIKADAGRLVITAKGHLDEVQELRRGGTKITGEGDHRRASHAARVGRKGRRECTRTGASRGSRCASPCLS